MLKLILICVAGFAAGVLFQAWRTARCTGQSIMAILRGGGSGEDR